MKTILITGGSGFIGTNLTNYYLKKKHRVIDLDMISYSSIPSKFKKLPNLNYYNFIKSNIDNKKNIFEIFKKKNIHLIINLASKSHVDRSIDNPVNFYQENVFSTLHFIDNLNYLKKKKIFTGKIVNISTDEVYGDVKGSAKNEKSCFETNSPYSASKASCETIFRSYFRTYSLPYINIRCCNNYGPFQHTEKFIPTVILKVLQNKKIPIYGNGFQKREWIYVNDFCNAIDFISKKGIIGENYNVGSNYRIENIKLAAKIIRILSDSGVKCNLDLIQKVEDRVGHDRNYKINSNKLRKMGWNNKIKFNEGLKNTVDWYLKSSDWIKFTKKKYKGERQGLKID